MRKCFVLGVCVAALSFVGQAGAAEGVISATSLEAMGLSSSAVVSDTVAAEVRGMGYRGHSRLPISLAAGGSFAGVGHEKASAGSINGYLAAGKYSASGENFSEAGKTQTHTERVNIDGVIKSVTTTKSIRVYAGGFSSSMSF